MLKKAIRERGTSLGLQCRKAAMGLRWVQDLGMRLGVWGSVVSGFRWAIANGVTSRVPVR